MRTFRNAAPDAERGARCDLSRPPWVSTVRRKAAAVPDDHIDWPPHGRPLRPEQWEPAGQRYESGASIRQLAAEIGRSYGFVHRYLTLAETTFQPRGGSRAKAAPGSDGADENTARTPGGRKPSGLEEEG
ncbi:helix-turn-helix domain-containing protein [Streptomyces griseofuscus]|uniref:helix-turn-helix domain-containing protein n=1 Tax=Streptomyces griseofuscus TaxID=146922 RepID=UPI0033F21882